MTPEDYWAKFFGLGVEELVTPGLKVVPHNGLRGYHGAWLFQIQLSLIISTPPEIVEDTKNRMAAMSENGETSPDPSTIPFLANVETVIGPCYQGVYNPEAVSAPAPKTSSIRLLQKSDQASLDDLKSRVEQEAWEHSSIAPNKTTFGYFKGKQIIAAACLDMWDERVASVGLVTDPAHRRKGLAKQICAAATAYGVSKNYLMLYQTLLANEPAVSVATSTGYMQYASHLAFRFKAPPN